jgi:DNA-binding LytR/AlgR family response regulator
VNTLIDQFFSQRGNFDVKTFEFRSMGNDYAIAYDEIIQIVGKDNYTEIRPYLKPEIRYYKNLAEVEALLNDDRFIRVHKSHLVHRGYVTHFDEAENMLVLVDHSKIKVSSRKAKEIKKIFPAK